MMAKLPSRLATRTDDTAAPIAWLIVVAAMLADTNTPVYRLMSAGFHGGGGGGRWGK